MKAEMEAWTQNGEQLIEIACRTCYQSFDRFNPPESTAKLIKHVIGEGHFSVLEHANATFKLSGVSRALTHELVRHRLFSFSQESQRYVCYADKPETDQPGRKGKARKKTKDFEYYTPPSVEAIDNRFEVNHRNADAEEIHNVVWSYDDVIHICYAYYENLLSKGIKPEDARYILPNAATSDIYITGNMRVWRHFLQLRCHPRAMTEIRELAILVKDILIEEFPNVFFDMKKGPLTEEDYKEIILT